MAQRGETYKIKIVHVKIRLKKNTVEFLPVKQTWF